MIVRLEKIGGPKYTACLKLSRLVARLLRSRGSVLRKVIRRMVVCTGIHFNLEVKSSREPVAVLDQKAYIKIYASDIENMV